jgi:hypothetical protein
MPTLSMFFGLVIRMYYKDHTPPHIHVKYQDDTAVVNITTGELSEGKLPTRCLRFVLAWIEIHQEELLADWQLCRNGEEPFRIEPLR